jgi:CRISPR-associated endonuclease/helicase Cas3
MKNGSVVRGGFDDMSALWDSFERKIAGFSKPTNELNAMRNLLLENCLAAAELPSGLFTLTAPTGSGKTISSAGFALSHAVRYGKQRIIYIVPYNTIIEQNAKVFEDMIGAENVLQHHCNINYESDENALDRGYRKRLATENWDAPFIVTSSVQFFESLFGNKPSVCRKLHSIANSVLVFDEAQMIPIDYLKPCVHAIRELVTNYNCTAVLATATQSSLDSYFVPKEGEKFKGL